MKGKKPHLFTVKHTHRMFLPLSFPLLQILKGSLTKVSLCLFLKLHSAAPEFYSGTSKYCSCHLISFNLRCHEHKGIILILIVIQSKHIYNFQEKYQQNAAYTICEQMYTCVQICPVQEECHVILMSFIHFIKQQYKLSICL